MTLTERENRYLPLRASGWNDGRRSEYCDEQAAGKTGAAQHYAGPGKKLTQHAVVAEVLRVKIYFLPPHQPWQRGANDNTNGLLRKYCPNDEYIEKAV